ncbi:uncharacterized protein BDZ99DRAFT_467845 [Mytilinidion resinicola]|uniref:Negative regulator of differentiation 1 n=1 Tax=Mytilinidion resinicola TaxID=574789 RepID=A0A6A6Y5C2_9PEZI|nr:uncharacterized protein BDZ99DRAFT_467845 [Mytilinidion resinicola]KAF2803723.1 hypothetical protein BDZ99DRAFT_467845 [Mytilinidion resinicola]
MASAAAFSLSNSITISKAEHEFLLRSAREYNVLRSALFRGGLTEDTLLTLINGENDYNSCETGSYSMWDESYTRAPSVPVRMSMPQSSGVSPDTSDSTAVGGALPKPRPSYHVHQGNACDVPDSYPARSYDKDESCGPETVEVQPSQPQPPFPRNDQRTVLLTNLSDRTTHKDLVDIVRGGRLLDIFLRNDRSATISFVEGAQDFLAYTKRNDIYIHDKRIETRWNDRQFHLPNHVANKIAIGATRNIVIRSAVGKLTAQGIREDLEHIHNLIVIDITFRGFDAFISTNSVHNALFARTCMMSRTGYKGLRIEWYPDECAAPIPRGSNAAWNGPTARSSARAAKEVPPPAKITNRFELLNMDESDSRSTSEDGEDLYSSNGVLLTGWADASILA